MSFKHIVVMPKMSMTMETGELINYHVNVGDHVKVQFLRAGKPAEPIDYTVERIRQGRNFFTRRVTALQGGHTIFEASISFTVTEPGARDHRNMFEHDPMTWDMGWDPLNPPKGNNDKL